MEDLMTFLPEAYSTWVMFTVIVLTALATRLSAPKEDSNAVYKIVYKIINWVAFNFGKAKNADEV